MATKAHLEGNKRYLAKLDEIRIRMPKGCKEVIKKAAFASGESMNTYIIRAVNEQMERDKLG